MRVNELRLTIKIVLIYCLEPNSFEVDVSGNVQHRC